jgi:hypothetical protein
VADEVPVGCGGGDQGGYGDVIDGSGLAASDLEDLGDCVVDDQVGGSVGGLEMMADAAGGLVGGHPCRRSRNSALAMIT